jgi:hypothetical protein
MGSITILLQNGVATRGLMAYSRKVHVQSTWIFYYRYVLSQHCIFLVVGKE